MIKQDTEKAKEYFDQAIMARPGWIVPYSNMVEIFQKEAKYNNGLKYLDSLKKRFPDQPHPDFYRGVLFFKNEEYGKARDVYEKFLEEYPDHNTLTANNLAYIYAEYFPSEENLEKAQRLASQIVRDYPNQYNTMDTLAWIYCKQGHYNKGIQLYEKFSDSLMNNPVYAYHLGICYLKKGDRENASRYLQKAADVSMNLYEVREAKRELEKLALQN
jgi:tetratricopeptide (TPR) repeat protein